MDEYLIYDRIIKLIINPPESFTIRQSCSEPCSLDDRIGAVYVTFLFLEELEDICSILVLGWNSLLRYNITPHGIQCPILAPLILIIQRADSNEGALRTHKQQYSSMLRWHLYNRFKTSFSHG